jgi:hypothetical protein
MFLKYYFALFTLFGVLFLICFTFLLVCACATLDGDQFEDPQGQDFEEFPEQQQFANEGKWSLIMFQPYLLSQIHLYFICMHVSRI